jgi:hypothetical protein
MLTGDDLIIICSAAELHPAVVGQRVSASGAEPIQLESAMMSRNLPVVSSQLVGIALP